MKKKYVELNEDLFNEFKAIIKENSDEALKEQLKLYKKFKKFIKKELKKRDLEADEFFNRELMGAYENE